MMNPWTFSASWAGLALIATQLVVWSWVFAALVAVATAARCPASNYGWDRIFSSPTSSDREEVTEKSSQLEKLLPKRHRWARWEALFLSDFREFWWPLMDHLTRSTL